MMKNAKKFYGKTILGNSNSDEAKSKYKMQLEYYEIEIPGENKPYGVEIVKKFMQKGKMQVEEKIVNNICNKEQDAMKLLEILINNKVTPVTLEDIIHDLRAKKESVLE